MMASFSIFFILISFVWRIVQVSGFCNQECVQLSQCPALLKYLDPPIDWAKLRVLQQATCDNSGGGSSEPKVCCPTRQTTTTTMLPPPPTLRTTTSPTTTTTTGGGGSQSQSFLNHPNLRMLPSSDRCGQSEGSSDRIAGGTDAGLGTYPWLVLIGFSQKGKTEPIFACGGSLINSRYVLTAAHCISGLPEGFTVSVVRVGEYDQSKKTDCAGSICAPPPQDILITEQIVHADYDKSKTKEHDIALLRLKRAASLGPFVIPVCLPHGEKMSKIPGMTKPFVAGWGRTTGDNPQGADILQHVKVPFQTMDKCNAAYASQLGHNVEEGRFCAGGEIGHDSCKGDSGGPLMMGLKTRTGEFRFFQYGIVSLGPKDCDSSTHPALYTKVSHYLTWILDHMRR